MLIFDKIEIGKNLYAYRKKFGLTQIEVAEKANLSDRTYADIERGSVNMRVDTLLKICDVLCITPNEILTKIDSFENTDSNILEKVQELSPTEKESLLKIVQVIQHNK